MFSFKATFLQKLYLYTNGVTVVLKHIAFPYVKLRYKTTPDVLFVILLSFKRTSSPCSELHGMLLIYRYRLAHRYCTLWVTYSQN